MAKASRRAEPDALHPVARAVARFATARALFRDGERIALAMSGGPDSCALLLALQETAAAGLTPPLAAILHFHHGMRGADADADAAFCEELALRFGLECRIGRGALGPRADEAAARKARYAFLVSTAQEIGVERVATAHTADDQAETVLLRVLRGASVDGLAGIPPRRRLSERVEVVRPLLTVRRHEILGYCDQHGLTARHDPTNDDLRFPRNRLRRLLPELADAFNPRLVEALGRVSELAGEDAHYLEAATDALEAQALREFGALEAAPLRAAPVALRRRVLLRALRRAAQPETVEALHTHSWVVFAEELLERSGRADLPGGIRLESLRGRLWTLPLSVHPLVDLPVPLPGEVTFPGGRLSAEVAPPTERPDGTATIDLAYPQRGALRLRTIREGDRFAPLGMSGRRRVRDLLADSGWPAPWRSRALVVVTGDTDEILWLVGVRPAQRGRVPEGDRADIRLRVVFDISPPAL